MAQLDARRIKKLKAGEKTGIAATVFCGAVLVYFAVGFALGRTSGNTAFLTVLWATAPALLVLGIAVSAYCNLKFGNELDKIIKEFVTETFVENAALMHPEKNSLSFFIEIFESGAEISVNGYKEKIIFDFSDFGKLSAVRKMTISKAITDRLNATFCRLSERGANYKSVDYREKVGSKKKAGKLVPIIAGGVPDKKAYKYYLKNK